MSGVITSLYIRWSDMFVDADGNKDEDGLSQDDPGGGAWFDLGSTSTTDYGLRAARWEDGGYSGNKYEVREFFTGGTGSGFEATVRYRKYTIDGGAIANKVKIKILDIHSYGTGYTVGDELSTPTWNNWPDAVQRVLKVRGATPSASLTANPTSIQAGSGETSNLEWESTNGSTYSLTGEASPGASGNKDVAPTTTTTYTYTVTSIDGDTASDTATVTVTAAPPPPAPTPTASLSASPTTVRVVGGSVEAPTVLTWSSTNGVSYSANFIVNPGASGNVERSPLTTTTYTYTVTNADGVSVSDSVTVTVVTIPSPTASITASPSSIELDSGVSSTLTWSSSDGNTYSLTPFVVANPGASGSASVTPTTTTTYKYTVTGEGGTAESTATVLVTVPDPPTATLTAAKWNGTEYVVTTEDPVTLIRGQSSKLEWSSTGGKTFSLTDIASPGSSGSAIVSPTGNKIYTYTVENAGGTDIDSVSFVVYEPPVITITANPTTAITAGNSVLIEWSTSGDADRIVWTQGPITNTNLTSNSLQRPTSTTTYSAYAIGLGGTSATKSVTVIVNQPPSLTVEYPVGIPFNGQGTIQYTSNFVNISLTLTPTYYYTGGVTVTGAPVELSRGSSAEAGVGITEVTDTYTTTIPWNSSGPNAVGYTIVGSGSGGPVTSSGFINITVDTTPDNLEIVDSVDLLADQQPVITPDTDVLSNQYLINDIDIDVEVKSNYPIQVQLNNSGTWENVREL